MSELIGRRDFIKRSAGIAGGLSVISFGGGFIGCASKPTFSISIAEWSLNNSIFEGDVKLLDFASITRKEFGLDAIEYVNVFFFISFIYSINSSEISNTIHNPKKRNSEDVHNNWTNNCY